MKRSPEASDEEANQIASAAEALTTSSGGGKDSGALATKSFGSFMSYDPSPSAAAASPLWPLWSVLGPGLLVCLADTDAGCLIVAAQSGGKWGYSLVWLQVLLTPITFFTQELTIRLAVHTQQGQVACLQQFYGKPLASFACFLLVLECVLAMVSEMSGIAAVAEIWGVGRNIATAGSVCTILGIVFSCGYKQVELIGITLGVFELTFVFTMFAFHPSPWEVLQGSVKVSADADFFQDVAANIGSVVMPWMIFFQQSAVVHRGLRGRRAVAQERNSTLLGCVLTQLVMIGTMVTVAAANSTRRDLHSVNDIIADLLPVLGYNTARVLVSLAFLGGSLAASFVVLLAATWSICDMLEVSTCSSVNLDDRPTSPVFYGACVLFMVIGVALLETGMDVVSFNMLVEFINGLLFPLTVCSLYFLATGDALPPSARVAGREKAALALVFGLCSFACLASTGFGIANIKGASEH
mmetsp:Transcript_73540/g.161071  ORF Transcript_73540/g.161071 Transcript_73540/m.161071 type:complete len:468 (+) Transcript_73540:66-1469(+)